MASCTQAHGARCRPARRSGPEAARSPLVTDIKVLLSLPPPFFFVFVFGVVFFLDTFFWWVPYTAEHFCLDPISLERLKARTARSTSAAAPAGTRTARRPPALGSECAVATMRWTPVYTCKESPWRPPTRQEESSRKPASSFPRRASPKPVSCRKAMPRVSGPRAHLGSWSPLGKLGPFGWGNLGVGACC